jgi:hypothetical protein
VVKLCIKEKESDKSSTIIQNFMDVSKNPIREKIIKKTPTIFEYQRIVANNLLIFAVFSFLKSINDWFS